MLPSSEGPQCRVAGEGHSSERSAVYAAAGELGIERAQCCRLLRRLRAEPTVTA
jgi:hypothetical protein